MKCEHMTCYQCTDAEVTTLRTTLARLTAEVGSLRGELATVRDELAKCADAVSGYFNDGDSVSDTVQVVADALGHAKAAEHGLTAELAAVTSDRDMWRSECESISAELDLPPGMRPMEGELRRMLGHNRALLAERDEARGMLGEAHHVLDQMHDAEDTLGALKVDVPDDGYPRQRLFDYVTQYGHGLRARIAAHLGRSE